jgi:hypothetical protein
MKAMSPALASKFEIEQAAIEGQSLFNVADLERHMVEADRTRFSVFGHGALQHVALNRGKPLLLLRGSVVFSLNTVGRGSIKKRLYLLRDHVGKFLLHRKLAMRQLDGLDARDGYERLHLCF